MLWIGKYNHQIIDYFHYKFLYLVGANEKYFEDMVQSTDPLTQIISRKRKTIK